jgi:hypothetical protein
MNSLLLLPLLLGGPVPGPTVAAPVDQPALDGYAELSAAYATALEEHLEKMRAAKGLKAKREVRESHPARSFWPRFEALAEEDGRGYLLMVQHIRDRDLSRKERGAEVERLHALLVREHVGAAWFGSVLDQLRRDARTVGDDFYREAHRAAMEKSRHDLVRAQGMYVLAKILLVSEVEAERAEGGQLFDRLVEELPGTEYAERAEAELFEIKYLGVGCEAPDFEAATLEGHEFKLSDYRGKVVLLDFYGFW